MRRALRRLPPLDRLLVFEAAARHLSFTRAAAECFLTQSAVSRQVAALEADLGTVLFKRRHRALDLTDDGRQLAAAATTALQALRDAIESIQSPDRREVVSLTTTPGFASLWLIPRLAGFTAAHPAIDVRIDASYGLRALAAEGFDVAIRYLPLGASQGGEALFAEAVEPVCAPALARRGAHPLKVPQDLRHHTLLKVDTASAGGVPLEWDPWLRAVGAGSVEPASVLTFSNYDNAVAAAVEGQGVVLGRHPLIDRLLKARRLVAPFAQAQPSARGYSVFSTPAAARRPAVQALLRWLKDEAAKR